MFRKLFFLCAAAAAGLALWFNRTENGRTQHWLAGWFGMALGPAMIALGQEGVVNGEIRGPRRYVSRDEFPVNFWGIVGIYYGSGLIMMGGAVWFLQFG